VGDQGFGVAQDFLSCEQLTVHYVHINSAEDDLDDEVDEDVLSTLSELIISDLVMLDVLKETEINKVVNPQFLLVV